MKTKILIIEDHPLMQMAIQTVLIREPDFELVPPLFTLDSILTHLQEIHPDLILLDLALPEISPIDLINAIRDHDKEVRILVYSGSSDHQLIARVMREKVNGYLTKNSSITELVKAIHSVMQGQPYFSGIATEALVKDFGDPQRNRTREILRSLTSRESEIFALLIQQQDTNEIALALNITNSAVRSHTTHLMRKFGVNSQKDLLVFAMQNDLM